MIEDSDDRLYAGKCHPADMAQLADFVQCPPAPRAGTCSTPAARVPFDFERDLNQPAYASARDGKPYPPRCTYSCTYTICGRNYVFGLPDEPSL